MKHKHYDKIVARAANMGLVVFIKCPHEWKQQITNSDQLNFSCGNDYFLCLPQHKEACLHWLNGGTSQVEYTKASYPYWCNIEADEANWSSGHIFMDESLNIRIKPRKEKKWIIAKSKSLASMMYFETENQAQDAIDESECEFSGGQAVECELVEKVG